MIEIKPPGKLEYEQNQTVFLAGSIEMGTAVDWQATVRDAMSDYDIVILNPRRDDWDRTWIQSIDNPKFKEQVDWELDAIDVADIVVFYFDPNTKSPITLLELGLCAASGVETIVCCPDGYWRKGNVEIVCKRFGMPLVATLDELVYRLRRELV
jgi:Nucleoside 2-deoxyribosyltransferase like